MWYPACLCYRWCPLKLTVIAFWGVASCSRWINNCEDAGNFGAGYRIDLREKVTKEKCYVLIGDVPLKPRLQVTSFAVENFTYTC